MKALVLTEIEVYLYDTQDPTEIIRSFDMHPQLLNRIHILTFSNDNELFKQCADDLSAGKVSVLVKGNLMSSTLLSLYLVIIAKHGFLNHVACFNV